MPNSFDTSSAAAAALSPSVIEDAGGPLRIPLIPEIELRQLYSSDPQTGTPRYAAARPIRSDSGGRQRWAVVFYPTPNEDLTLEYRYTVNPGNLSEGQPYPLGGKQYAECLLASCLAVSHEKDQSGPAVFSQFMAKLAAAALLEAQTIQISEEHVWPIEKESNGLTANKAYLKRLVGRHRMFGPHPSGWSHKQLREVELAVETGLRKFSSPPVLPGERYAHDWSFLRPLATLHTASGQYLYDLPRDFAMLHGPLTFAPGASAIYPSLQLVGEHQIRSRLQRSEATCRPEMAAVVMKSADSAVGTLYELYLWPVPNDDYEIQFRYSINPEALADDAALPLGGQPHVQTIIEACLSSADEQSSGASNHTAMYLERIVASVSHDRSVCSPDTLGYNRDFSDAPRDSYALDWHENNFNLVTYRGYTDG